MAYKLHNLAQVEPPIVVPEFLPADFAELMCEFVRLQKSPPLDDKVERYIQAISEFIKHSWAPRELHRWYEPLRSTYT
jgi:hypothetical protein